MSNNMITNRQTLLGVGLVMVLAATPLSLHRSPTQALSLSLDTANARIGNPASPGSIAGVHRRVYRRSARLNDYGAGAAAVGAAAVGAAGAAYVAANQNYGYGYSPTYGSGYNNLYNYAPATPVTTTAAVAQSSTQPSLSPELYAACVDRTFGNCPH
jgi:hypothetical protein